MHSQAPTQHSSRGGHSSHQRSRALCSYAAAIFFCVISAVTARAQEQETTDRIKELTIRQGDLIVQLQALSSRFGLPIAVERARETTVPVPDEIPKIYKDVSLADAYDLLVAANPQYRWRINNGVAEFVPIAVTDGYRFLDVEVNQLDAIDLTVDEIKSNVIRDPEVQGALKADGLTVTDISFASQGRSTLPRHSMRYRRVTVRELFNSLLKETERNFWIVSCWGEKNEYLRIFFN